MKEQQDDGQEEPVQVTYVNPDLANNEGPAKHSKTAKQDPAILENDGASSSSTNESENKKSNESKVLLLHKLGRETIFCQRIRNSKACRVGGYSEWN